MNLSQCFYVKPAENEIIETTVQISCDKRPAIIGTVLDPNKKPLPSSLVLISKSQSEKNIDKIVGCVYSDEVGQFAFGGLEPGVLYKINVYCNYTDVRTLE